MTEMEVFWKRYLHHLDRIWNKAEAHFSKSPKWSSWHGKYLRLRRNDQLLSYLLAARNVDEHSISDITEKQQGFTGINSVTPGGTVHIKKLVIGPKGEISFFEAASPVTMTFRPNLVHLLPVENRGRTYPAPKKHLGGPVNPLDLVNIAERGVAFYKGFLEDAEAKFVVASKSS
jgi:hypothetical protein